MEKQTVMNRRGNGHTAAKWVVRIWKSVPDPLDGFYCELGVYHKSAKHTIFVSEECNWFPTVALCELWAKDRGAIEYK